MAGERLLTHLGRVNIFADVLSKFKILYFRSAQNSLQNLASDIYGTAFSIHIAIKEVALKTCSHLPE